MDGHFVDAARGNKAVAFLTPGQAELYGGYVDAAKTLRVDFIRPPCFLDEHWADLADHSYGEVGHC